jgi:uncharacterized ParB-like nuclease family protein/transposase-like protein
MGRTTELQLNLIRTDGGTQPRSSIDERLVAEYAQALLDGTQFPPVDVFYDGNTYWLAHGFHRHHAHRKAARSQISANIHQGTQQDAQWFSYAANKDQDKVGLRRTNADKERAVRAALGHPKGSGLTNRLIAEHVGVDEGTVRKWRAAMETTAEIPQSPIRTGLDGRTINTARIGTSPRPTQRQQPPSAPDPIRPAQPASASIPIVPAQSSSAVSVTADEPETRAARPAAFSRPTPRGFFQDTLQIERVLRDIRQQIKSVSGLTPRKHQAMEVLELARAAIKDLNKLISRIEKGLG